MVSDILFWTGVMDEESETFFRQGGGAFRQEGGAVTLWCGCSKGLSDALCVPGGSWVTWSEGRFYVGFPSEASTPGSDHGTLVR